MTNEGLVQWTEASFTIRAQIDNVAKEGESANSLQLSISSATATDLSSCEQFLACH